MWERIRDVVFPAQCAACDAVGSGLCARCFPGCDPTLRNLPTLTVTALGTYESALRASILALKDGRRDVAHELGRRLAALASPGVILVPVPTSGRRLRERGVDGVRAIAETMAGLTHSVKVCKLLVQCNGEAQQGRSRTARLGARGRFRIGDDDCVATNVVLVDDVVTTGATLEDCAATLRAGGYRVTRAIAAAVAETDVDAVTTKSHDPWRITR